MAQSGVNKSIKKDPVDNNEINTFNQSNYNTQAVSLEAEKLAKKYSNLLVTNGPEGRRAANDARIELNKFIKENEADFKQKKKQVTEVLKVIKKQLDEALSPAVKVRDDLRALIEESQQAQHTKQDQENRMMAYEMAKNLGIAPNFVDKIIDYESSELYPLTAGKMKRLRYIDSKLRYALENGFVRESKDGTKSTTFNVKTGERISEIKTVVIELKGSPFVIELALDTLKDWKGLEVKEHVGKENH